MQRSTELQKSDWQGSCRRRKRLLKPSRQSCACSLTSSSAGGRLQTSRPGARAPRLLGSGKSDVQSLTGHMLTGHRLKSAGDLLLVSRALCPDAGSLSKHGCRATEQGRLHTLQSELGSLTEALKQAESRCAALGQALTDKESRCMSQQSVPSLANTHNDMTMARGLQLPRGRGQGIAATAGVEAGAGRSDGSSGGRAPPGTSPAQPGQCWRSGHCSSKGSEACTCPETIRRQTSGDIAGQLCAAGPLQLR